MTKPLYGRVRPPWLAAGIVALALSTALAAVQGPAAADPDPGDAAPEQAHPSFEPSDAGELSTAGSAALGATDVRDWQRAVATGEDEVTVLIAAAPGETDQVAALVEELGGAVGSTVDEVGYVRATVPVEKVDELATSGAVRAVDLNREYRLPKAPKPAAAASGRAKPPNGQVPAVNPYLPVNDTGAVRFTRNRPRSDGRGITIGILDSGVDLDHPALQRTTTGQRKVVDWVTSTDPLLDGDGTWLKMTTAVSGPTFKAYGATWTSPEGDFTLTQLREYVTSYSEFEGNLNRDDNYSDSWGVLFDRDTDTVWVDVDQDRAFEDSEAMTAYGDDGDIGHFGTDDPDTAVKETVPFVVEPRKDVDLSPLGGSNTGKVADFVNIGIVAASHGTHVAGIAAGNRLFGGRMRGAAPGARIVSSRACTWGGGCTSAALTEGMIDLVVDRDVDVVNMSIGGSNPLNDGSDAIAMLYQRLVDDYDAQIVVSAGNDGPGANTVGSPAVAHGVISVAASASRGSWAANYGAEVAAAHSVFGFSSRGPAEDGGLAPAVTAPGSAVSTFPLWLPPTNPAEAGYRLPVGYATMQGTSMAAPQAAGDAALLLSAAKASGVRIAPGGLRAAILGEASPIAGTPATAQGAGLIDVPAAWRTLKSGAATAKISVSAPVCTVLSDHLPKAGRGVGVYNRCLPHFGGQRVGETRRYRIRLTSSRSGSFALSWQGNDGTFRTDRRVRLTKDRTSTVTVVARAARAGTHAAVLRVDKAGTPGVDALVPTTVLTTTPTRRPQHRVSFDTMLPRTATRSFLVPVPRGVNALELGLSAAPGTGQNRVIAIDPTGTSVDPTASDKCFTQLGDGNGCPPTRRAYYDPMPGVWEFVVESRRTSRPDRSAVRATVDLLGVSFSPDRVEVDTAALNKPTPVRLRATNKWGRSRLKVRRSDLGYATDLWSTVQNGQVNQGMVNVPRKTTRLDMTLTSRDATADLDFMVAFRGELVGTSQHVGPGVERIVLHDPEPGSYTLVVAGTSVPSGSAEFDYHEELYSAGAGTVTGNGTPVKVLDPGTSMRIEAQLTPTSAPLGRHMVGRVQVTNPHRTILGASVVDFGEVISPQAEVLNWMPPFVGSDMSNSAMIGGDHQVDARMTPTLWTAEDGFTDLDLAGGEEGSVLNITEDGRAVGLFTREWETMPAMWRADGTLVEIGLPDWQDYEYGYATAINESGVVVGFAYATISTPSGPLRVNDAFRWTEEGGFTRLRHLSPLSDSQPSGINAQGEAVGYSLGDDGRTRAVRWSADGSVEALDLPAGQVSAEAWTIDDGSTVVGRSGDDAVVWQPDGTAKVLPDFGYNAEAVDRNADGWVVGTAGLAPDMDTVVVWDPQGRIWDLGAMVDGFMPETATGITDDGRVAVYGYGGQGGEGSSSALLKLPDLP